MISYEQWLQYLLYLKLSLTHPADFITEHARTMHSGSTIPFCNRVYADPQVTDEEIKQVIDSLDGLPFRWFVHENNTAYAQKLERHGLHEAGGYPAMVLELAQLQEHAYQSELRIEEVRTTYEIDSWIAVAAEGMEVNRDDFATFVRYILKYATPNTVHLYRALYNDTPVATNMLIQRNAVVSMHCVATLAQYRGKGIGTAVTEKPWLKLREHGAITAILLASDMGKSVYEKMGFKSYAFYWKYELPGELNVF